MMVIDWILDLLDSIFSTELERAMAENRRLNEIKRTRELEAENAKLREELGL